MSGLIKRLLGIKPPKVKSFAEREAPLSEIEEPVRQEGKYSVPETLNPEGFYAIQIAQAEMYDLGNIDFIDHFLLYDRKSGIGIDITSDIKAAPLLSATQPANVFSSDNVDLIENYLTGRVKPECSDFPGFPEGVKCFVAVELIGNKYEPLRENMVRLRDTQAQLKTLTDAFGNEIQGTGLKDSYSF